MLDFDDRDLVALAEAAGFARIHLELPHRRRGARRALRAISIDALLDSAPNPLGADRAREHRRGADAGRAGRASSPHLRRAVEAGDRLRRSAVAYLVASKPG